MTEKKMPVVFVAWATDGNKLSAKSICKTAPKSLFWVPTCGPRFKSDHDWPVEKINCQFANQVGRKI